jgi:hypothetical protein
MKFFIILYIAKSSFAEKYLIDRFILCVRNYTDERKGEKL